MIILMKNRRLDKFKKYYTAVCLNCGSKFAFSEDDMGGLYRNMWITCPVWMTQHHSIFAHQMG